MDTSHSERDGLTARFKVVIPDLRDVYFDSCEGLESEIEVVQLPEGGRLVAPRTARGTQRVNRLSFSHGSVQAAKGGHTLFDWYLDVCDASKRLTKKTISIMVTDATGKEIAEWRILNAWPCRWVAPIMSGDQNTLSVEYISFAHEGIERKK